MQTPDLTEGNVTKIAQLFPNVITEKEGSNGIVEKVVDFELLKQMLSKELVEDDNERYRLDWPGKKASLLKANTPITMTLRPDRDSSVNFDTTENVFIEGDNFEVLKVLQESYLGKIKVIYVDPPYNTGTAMIYNNDFSISDEEYEEEIGAMDEDGFRMFKNTDSNGRFHSDWLSMMYERITVARDLLTEDGFITIAIDHNELHNLTSICDEIFGEDNRIGILCVRNNPAGRSTAKGVSITNEYALLYAKSDKSSLCRLSRNDKQISRYNKSDENGTFEWVNFRKPGSKKEESPKMYYPIFISPNSVRVPKMNWNATLEAWELLEKTEEGENIIYPIDEDGKDRRWRWAVDTMRENLSEFSPVFIKDKWHVNLKARMPNDGVLPSTWWDKKEYSSTAYGTNLIKEIFSELQIFSYPKSIYAVMDSIRVMSNSENDLILDFFAGSATTAHAVMQLNAEDGGNRKYIMVQIPEKTEEDSEAYKAGYKYISDISKERIRRVGKKILEENKEELAKREKPLDVGFRAYKADTTNMKDVYYHPSHVVQEDLFNLVSNIKEDRTPEDLLTQVILNLGLTLDLPIEKKELRGNAVYFVAGNALVACFDDKIDFGIVDDIATHEPLKVVFKDASFKEEQDRTNVDTRMKRLSPETIITVL